MKNKSILLLCFCFIMIIGLAVGGFRSFDFNNKVTYYMDNGSDNDDNYNYNFNGGEFDYQLSIGEEKEIIEIFDSFQLFTDSIDFSTLKIISNQDESIVKFDSSKNILVPIKEGEDKLVFSLNGEKTILNIIVKDVETSNASGNSGEYSIKKWQSPRFSVGINGTKMSLTVGDSTGINTNDIVLYKVDKNKKVIKKLNIGCSSLNGNKKYSCVVSDNNVLVEGNNYYYIVIKDKNGYKNESYFTVTINKGTYSRDFGPKVNNLNAVNGSVIAFDVNSGDKIKSLVVYDLNNNKKIVLSKNDIIASTINMDTSKLISKNNKKYINIVTEDFNGNRTNVILKIGIVQKSISSSSSNKHNILFIGNSKSWRGGNKTSGGEASTRPIYEFLKMLKKRGNYISSDVNNLGSFKFYKADSANVIARNDEVTILTRGGSGLLKIMNKKNGYSGYVSDRSYDIVFLQEYNYVSGASKKGTDTRDVYINGVKKVLDNLKNKNAKIYLRASWPNPYYSNSTYKVNYKFYRDKIYNNSVSVLNELKNDKKYSTFEFYLVKDTKAMDLAISKNIAVTLTNNTHQNANGAYLVGACMYSSLFGENPQNLGYSGYVSNSNIRKKINIIAYDICKDTSY